MQAVIISLTGIFFNSHMSVLGYLEVAKDMIEKGFGTGKWKAFGKRGLKLADNSWAPIWSPHISFSDKLVI